MLTLHAYVLRELLKTFGLTLAALTALFTMGGGLYNVLRYEGIGAADLFGSIPLLLPIMATLAMPVAALFTATMIYGRLAADNELLACRAAGINIHRLFASAGLLALFVAVCILLSTELVVPDIVRRLDQFVRANLRDLALQKLQAKGYVHYEASNERYLLTAEAARSPTRRALTEQGLPTDPGITYLLLDNPVFLLLDRENWLARSATAHHGLCQFDARSEPLEVTLFVHEGRDFDIRGSSAHLKRQQIGPIVVPRPIRRRASMVDLRTLRRWRERPWEVDQLKIDVRKFRQALLAQWFLDDCRQQVAASQPIRLTNERGESWRITASTCTEHGRGVLLTDVHVAKLPRGTPGPLSYRAPLALLSPRPALPEALLVASSPADSETLLIRLDLQRTADRPVIEHHPRASDYETGRPKGDLTLPDLFHLPTHLYEQARRYDEQTLFDPSLDLPLQPSLAEKRTELLDSLAQQRRKMAATIHFRLGIASSALVTVLMAAALGVIFRGGRALAAFGLACIPFGVVAVLIVMARSLGEKPGTELLAPLLTWGGLALLGVADMVIVWLGVRR